MQDSATFTALPAGIDVASVWRRLFAMLIDGLILLIPGWLSAFILFGAGPVLVTFLYYPLFHASAMQATLGKKIMGIRVTSASGQTLSLGHSFLRHFVALASSCFLFLGHFFVFFNKEKQALHDLVAGSLVLKGDGAPVPAGKAWLDTTRNAVKDLGKVVGSNENPTNAKHTAVRLEKLERLHTLREKGVLSEEEYQRLRKELI